MTQINLDTHQFGHKITPEHPFMKSDETDASLVQGMEIATEPTGPTQTSLLIEDLTVQLQSANFRVKVLMDSRNSWRKLAIQYSAELTEYEMSYWAKFKRWIKKQWSYDIYDEHFKG